VEVRTVSKTVLRPTYAACGATDFLHAARGDIGRVARSERGDIRRVAKSATPLLAYRR
jgi:hypothetical protein